MKFYSLLGLAFATATILGISGCSDDGDGVGSGSNLTGEPVVITTAADAQNAISLVSALSSIADSNSVSYSSRRAPSRVPVNETEQCSDGGTISIIGDADDYKIDVTMTYNSCIEYDTTTNGAISMVGTDSNGNIDMRIIMSNFKTESSSMSMLMNMTTDAKWNDYDSSYMDMLMNGTASYTIVSPSESGKAGFENFHLIFNSNTFDVEGKASSESSAHSCTDGIYSLDTTELLYISSSYSGFDSGTMIINDTTFVFNNDNTATVTFTDGSTATVQQNSEIICN